MCLNILKLLGAKNVDCNPMYIILKYYIKDNCFMNFKLMEMDSSSYFEDFPSYAGMAKEVTITVEFSHYVKYWVV